MLRVGKSRLKAVAAAAILAAPTLSMAQTSGTWTFQGSQSFNFAPNWNLGSLPGGGGIATFDSTFFAPSNTTYTVTLAANVTLGGFNFNGDFATNNKSYTLAGSSVFTLNSNSTIKVDSGVQTINAAINASGNVVKSGAGTLVLGGGNTFATAITVTGGTLRTTTNLALRNALIVTTANNGVLELGGGGALGTIIMGLGSTGAPGGTIHNLNGATTLGGNWFVVSAGTVAVDSGSSLSLNGGIFDGDISSNGFTKTGAGTFWANNMVLNGTLNATAGQFNVVGGTVSSSVKTANVTGGTFAVTGGTFGVTDPVNVNGGQFQLSNNAQLTGNMTVASSTSSYIITGSRVVGNLNANNGNGTITGASSISGVLNVAGGTHTVHSGTLTLSSPAVVAGGTFVVGTGTTATRGVIGGGVNVNSGTALFNGATVNGTLAVNGGTARLVSHTTANIAGGVLRINGALSIAPTKALDITNNSMILDYTGASPVAAIRSLLIAGRGGVGLGAETWAGPGINSSAFTGDINFGLGYADNGALPLGSYGSYGGQTVDDTSILFRWTKNADANLDGIVNDDDVTIVGAFYNSGATDWSTGDFDYNGVTNDDDVTLLGALYAPSAPPFSEAALAALYGQDFANAFELGQSLGAAGLVPEPASFAILGTLGTGLLMSRRRRKEGTN